MIKFRRLWYHCCSPNSVTSYLRSFFSSTYGSSGETLSKIQGLALREVRAREVASLNVGV